MDSTRGKLAELQERLAVAREPAGEAGIRKRAMKGIPSARARIEDLLDAGSFVELGALVRQAGSDSAFYGDGVVTGVGRIEGRSVVVIAHDQTVYGGSVGEMFGRKVAHCLDFAFDNAYPVVSINDSGGARIQDAVTSLAWFAAMSRRIQELSGYVPLVSVMLGKCAAGAVYAPINSDVLVATASSCMFVTGPEVIRAVTGEEISAEELGGAHIHSRNGTVHFVANSENEALDWVRQYLGFFPASCTEEPPIVNPGLEPSLTQYDYELNSIIPDSDKVPYDIFEILIRIFDDGDVFEIGSGNAPNLVTAFSRVDGRSIGVIANQPLVQGGALDAQCSDKATHFIRLCDAFGIPLVFIVDTPGVLPGVDEERNGVIKRGGRFFHALVAATVPIVTVIVRKAFGGGYAVMGSQQLGADISLAWPTAQIAVMGAESMIEIVGKRHLDSVAASDRPTIRRALIDDYNRKIATPWIAAERGYIEAVIEPAATRLEIRKALHLLREKRATQRSSPRKHSLMPI